MYFILLVILTNSKEKLSIEDHESTHTSDELNPHSGNSETRRMPGYMTSSPSIASIADDTKIPRTVRFDTKQL